MLLAETAAQHRAVQHAAGSGGSQTRDQTTAAEHPRARVLGEGVAIPPGVGRRRTTRRLPGRHALGRSGGHVQSGLHAYPLRPVYPYNVTCAMATSAYRRALLGNARSEVQRALHPLKPLLPQYVRVDHRGGDIFVPQ